MADHKAMYLAAMDAMEQAVQLLAEAQQKCEDVCGDKRRGAGGAAMETERNCQRVTTKCIIRQKNHPA